MKILITGGLGNLGSWITERLAGSGHEVAVFSLNNRNVNIKYDFSRFFGDITNEEDVKKIINHQDWDAIIHLASINEGNIPGYPKKAILVNTWGSRNILQQLSSNKKKQCHFIYFSTFHVYGVSSGLISENETLLNPKNDYGATHLFAEYYIKQLHSTQEIPYTIFRLTNGYGCPKDKDSSKWHLVLNDLARSAFKNKRIQLNSNGLPTRDFIWMGDVCKAVESCLQKGPSNNIFNLGSGNSIRMIDVANIVKDAYKNYFNEIIPVEVNSSDKIIYSNDLLVSTEKLRNWIDFAPSDKMHSEAIEIFKLLGN